MTALVQAEVDGERLTHAEIGAFFVLLSVAGNDTTRHTTSHAMRALTVNPDQRAVLIEDLDGRLPVAVEEFVRWASPVLTFRRTTTREVEIHGEQLAAGERVVLFYHSGNRDEEAFTEPWRFDLTRDPNRHLGFGGGRAALLPRRLAGAHPAALDLRRAAARRAGHRGAGARAAAQQFHPWREAHAVQLQRPSLREDPDEQHRDHDRERQVLHRRGVGEPVRLGPHHRDRASTEEPIGSVPEGTNADIDAAVAAARAAFEDPTGWSSWSAEERAQAIERLAGALESRGEETARRVSMQNGMPISLAMATEAVYPAVLARYYAALIRDLPLQEERQGMLGGQDPA